MPCRAGRAELSGALFIFLSSRWWQCAYRYASVVCQFTAVAWYASVRKRQKLPCTNTKWRLRAVRTQAHTRPNVTNIPHCILDLCYNNRMALGEQRLCWGIRLCQLNIVGGRSTTKRRHGDGDGERERECMRASVCFFVRSFVLISEIRSM